MLYSCNNHCNWSRYHGVRSSYHRFLSPDKAAPVTMHFDLLITMLSYQVTMVSDPVTIEFFIYIENHYLGLKICSITYRTLLSYKYMLLPQTAYEYFCLVIRALWYWFILHSTYNWLLLQLLKFIYTSAITQPVHDPMLTYRAIYGDKFSSSLHTSQIPMYPKLI